MQKVSVIVPVYKVERYFSQCIESILTQTYINWELILVDDGSPDKSGRICDDYADKDSRIRVVHKQNAGVGAARNTGLENATGEFIAFVDSDDFCESSYLENFGLTKGQPADLVIQGFKKYINGECPGTAFQTACYTRNELVEAILDNNLLSFGAPYCKLFRREIIERNHIRFSTKYSFGEDTYFFFDYLTHIFSMQVVAEDGYYYRCDQEGSLSVKNHDFIDLVTFANDSLGLLRKIDNNCKLETAYSYSYVGLYARALANMYRLEYDWSERISCIKYVKNNDTNIQLFNGNNSYRLVYLFARNVPAVIVDAFLYLNNKTNH